MASEKKALGRGISIREITEVSDGKSGDISALSAEADTEKMLEYMWCI